MKTTITLLLLRGLPGSGKSTYARKLLEEAHGKDVPKWKRINKDMMRDMLDLDDWSGQNEHLLNGVVEMMIQKYLWNGFNVVSDNMNLAADHVKTAVRIANDINERSEKYQVQLIFKDFRTPIETCIKRDAGRPGPVTEAVIRKIQSQYMHDGFPDVSKQLEKLTGTFKAEWP